VALNKLTGEHEVFGYNKTVAIQQARQAAGLAPLIPTTTTATTTIDRGGSNGSALDAPAGVCVGEDTHELLYIAFDVVYIAGQGAAEVFARAGLQPCRVCGCGWVGGWDVWVGGWCDDDCGNAVTTLPLSSNRPTHNQPTNHLLLLPPPPLHHTDHTHNQPTSRPTTSPYPLSPSSFSSLSPTRYASCPCASGGSCSRRSSRLSCTSWS
jgi:hypothetical protein